MGEITGTPGNDTIFGSGAGDVMRGLGGDDIYVVVNAADSVVEQVGEGNDIVYTTISWALTEGSYVETLSTIDWSQTTALSLTGNSFANTIFGNAGANFLNGGAGADEMSGFGGDDTYVVDNAGDKVNEAAGQGNDVVYALTSYALSTGSSVETISAIDWSQAFALNLTGNELNNKIYGNAGANFLNGGGGADELTGFGGNDTYIVDNAGDLVNEGQGAGNDIVYALVSYQLAQSSSVETLSAIDWTQATPLNFTGNELNNNIYGNAGANVLNGASGADEMTGFGGNDVYVVDNAGDKINEAVGAGSDAVYALVDYTLSSGASVEMLSAIDWTQTTALNLTGNELDNPIYGNAGANLLNGAGGADTMTGFGGDDLYVVDNAGDTIVEAAGGGNDTVYALVDYTLSAGAAVETLTSIDWSGTGALNLTGNELANSLFGNAGANVLNGGAGNDSLRGFGGADSFAFTTALGANNVDTIVDFQTGLDKIRLGGAAGEPFAALATGSLRAGTLVIGAAALDADDYLIYNSATGALLYDADGNGAGAAVQFATLAAGLNLTLTDFIVSGAANNAPAVTSGATASVAENSAAGTIVYQTVANDADGDRITYSLSGADAALLNIDANGAVRLNNPADFETKNSYVFNVVASDSGVATVKAVTLAITDVNENASTPIIQETAASNNTQGTAQAIDAAALVIANNPNLVNDAYPSISIQGSISAATDTATTSTDVDFYSITLQAGQQIILDVDGTTQNGLDSFLTLYGPNGVAIGSNDDAGSFDPGSVETGYGHNVDSQIIFRVSTTGTYWFSIKSFVDPDTNKPDSKGAYTLHVSINSTPVTAAQILADDIDALNGGASWNHAGPAFTLTYGFPTLASYYPQSFSEVALQPGDPGPAPMFQAFNATQQAATRALLGMIANVTQISFQENTAQGNYDTAGTAANANLRYAESSEALPTAYAYMPTNGGAISRGGSAWFGLKANGTSDFDTPQRGNYPWMAVLHETGHALGLKHGHEFPLKISVDRDSVEYSVMTYRSFPGQDLENGGGYTNEQWGFAQTLMMLDIAALQKIYGSANYNYNSGTSVYTWSATTGEMSINGVGQGAPGNGDGFTQPGENRIFMTIWDGGGNDTYDLSNYGPNGGVVIDLRPGEWTSTNSSQTANLGGGHFARGNIANALLFEGDTRSAIENAKGGGGSDTLIANLVANQLTGNGGNDIFKWMSTSDAGIGQAADTVLDFVRGSDKIDFSNFDTNPDPVQHGNFFFIGTSAFHNVAGEVRYDVTGGSAHIFADADGNGIADMEIILTNITTLATPDFNF